MSDATVKQKITLHLRKTCSSLRYALYVIFHPFDGFWCLKREKCGDVTAGTFILFLLFVVTVLSKQFTGFIFNFNDPREFDIVKEVLGVVVPVLLWTTANWGITTLMDGEGSLKDIYIACCYSLTPLVLTGLPLILFSRAIALEEGAVYTVIYTISVIWSGFLLFSGTMITHQYSLRKTLITMVIVIVGMALIVFLVMLFFALIQELINFLFVFYKEYQLRFD